VPPLFNGSLIEFSWRSARLNWAFFSRSLLNFFLGLFWRAPSKCTCVQSIGQCTRLARVWTRVAVCCSVLQCVAVRYSVLQCIAVCCIITNEAAKLPTVESMWQKRSSINSIKYLGVYYNLSSSYSPMGWLRLVGSLKLLVFFADYSLFSRALLQKRPTI